MRYNECIIYVSEGVVLETPLRSSFFSGVAPNNNGNKGVGSLFTKPKTYFLLRIPTRGKFLSVTKAFTRTVKLMSFESCLHLIESGPER